MNLYGFVGNDGVGKWDYLGLLDDITIDIPYDLPSCDDKKPTIRDNFTCNCLREGAHLGEEDWWESYDNGEFLNDQKTSAQFQIDLRIRIGCKNGNRPNSVNGHWILAFPDRLELENYIVVGTVLIKTEDQVAVTWNGKYYKWKATLTIHDRLGLDTTSSTIETLAYWCGGALIAPTVNVTRAKFEIEGEGCCDEK